LSVSVRDAESCRENQSADPRPPPKHETPGFILTTAQVLLVVESRSAYFLHASRVQNTLPDRQQSPKTRRVSTRIRNLGSYSNSDASDRKRISGEPWLVGLPARVPDQPAARQESLHRRGRRLREKMRPNRILPQSAE